MNESASLHIYKFSVSALTDRDRAAQLTNLIRQRAPQAQVDINLAKQLLRIVSADALEIEGLRSYLREHDFHLQAVKESAAATISEPATPDSANQPTVLTVGVSGMTCRACELTIERSWRKIPGVKKVDANTATGRCRLILAGPTPSLDELQKALGPDAKYKVHRDSRKSSPMAEAQARPSFWRIVALFALVLLLGKILTSVGLFKTSFNISDGASFGAIFVVGLIAASSSCIAVSGGLLLTAAAKFNERYSASSKMARMRPVLLFVAGRIISYTVLGGLLGVVGGILAPSTTTTAIIALLAATYMLIMGLDMLRIAPAWTKRILPRMPKGLSHRILDAENKEHPLAPFMLGAATFFLPCGFTQALQLYALTTNSFSAGALVLLAFALGTAPSLLALGFASSSLKGKAGRWFFQFSGALVIVLGLWNIQNGLAILGYPINVFNDGSSSAVATSAPAANSKQTALSGTMDGDTQVIKMGFKGTYSPNSFTLRAGTPVRWEIDGSQIAGCASVLVSRQLGIQEYLTTGINTITFTPKEAGNIAFSCGMGMYRGSFTVLPAI